MVSLDVVSQVARRQWQLNAMISLDAYMSEMRHLERAINEALHNKDRFALATLRDKAATLNSKFWGRELGPR